MLSRVQREAVGIRYTPIGIQASPLASSSPAYSGSSNLSTTNSGGDGSSREYVAESWENNTKKPTPPFSNRNSVSSNASGVDTACVVEEFSIQLHAPASDIESPDTNMQKDLPINHHDERKSPDQPDQSADQPDQSDDQPDQSDDQLEPNGIDQSMICEVDHQSDAVVEIGQQQPEGAWLA